MSDHSSIEWTDATWQPITGCSVVSPGCTNCYAMKLAGTRLKRHPSRAGLTRDSKAGPVWTGEVRFNREWLTQPLKWKRGRTIFVCAHGDLFAEGVPDEWIDQVFAVMALAPHHTFQVLTKRPKRMRAYMTGSWQVRLLPHLRELGKVPSGTGVLLQTTNGVLPNVWLGTSVEDQRRADERIPQLLATPAAVRFVSVEPLLGPIVLWHFGISLKACEIAGIRSDDVPGLDWVIVGGESGAGARPMHPDWARSLRDQCAAAGVPFFFKQWGEWLDADTRLAELQAVGFEFRWNGKPWPRDRQLTFEAAESLASSGGFAFEHHSDGRTYLRLGKKRAGRLLDGELHDAMPARAGG